MKRTEQKPQCIQCRHFRNSPEFLESVFKGLTTLSSGYASITCEDGICLLTDRYLAANRSCDRFELHPSLQKGRSTSEIKT
ncbi:MAG: hypothetical protein WBG50_00640 [Desulfomonilaceae bacterium]